MVKKVVYSVVLVLVSVLLMAFTTSGPMAPGIWMSSTYSGQTYFLPTNGLVPQTVSWSPDGGSIAFGGQAPGLWIYNIQTRQTTQVFAGGGSLKSVDWLGDWIIAH